MVAVAAASEAARAVGQRLFDASNAISRDRVYAQKMEESIALKYADYNSSTIKIDGVTEEALDAIAKSALSLDDKRGFIAAVATLLEGGGDPAVVRDMVTLVKMQEAQNSQPTEAMTLDEAKNAFVQEVKDMRLRDSVFSLAMGNDKVNSRPISAPGATFGLGDPYLLLAEIVDLMSKDNPFASPVGNLVNLQA